MPVTLTNEFDCADAIIARVGKQLKVATPLAAGKPVTILNALYQRAKEDPQIELQIYTALTLARPQGKSLLERRFLEPFVERVFGDYPDPEFHLDRERDALPSSALPRRVDVSERSAFDSVTEWGCTKRIKENFTKTARHA